jgi:hypothetical protein
MKYVSIFFTVVLYIYGEKAFILITANPPKDGDAKLRGLNLSDMTARPPKFKSFLFAPEP